MQLFVRGSRDVDAIVREAEGGGGGDPEGGAQSAHCH